MLLTTPVCVGEVDDDLAIQLLVAAPQEDVGQQHEEADDDAAGHEDVAQDEVENHPRLHLRPHRHLLLNEEKEEYLYFTQNY